MAARIPAEQLRFLRNQIDVRHLITTGLRIPCKIREGYLRFLCPVCGDFHTATHSGTNLARCFRCERNFNTIDLTMIVNRCGFLDAVRFLNRFHTDRTAHPSDHHLS